MILHLNLIVQTLLIVFVERNLNTYISIPCNCCECLCNIDIETYGFDIYMNNPKQSYQVEVEHIRLK